MATPQPEATHWHLTTFTPAEVARITGVPPTLQRDWRRRRVYGEHSAAWTKLRTDQVAEVLLRKTLIHAGFKQIEFHQLSRSCGASIVSLAVEVRDATVADSSITAESWQEAFDTVTPVSVQYLLKRQSAEREDSILPFLHWEQLSAWLEDQRKKDFAAVATIVDLEVLAKRLARLAGKPLMRLMPGEAPNEDSGQAT